MTTGVESLGELERAADYNVEIELTNGAGEPEIIVCRKLGFGAIAEAAAFVKKQRRMEYMRDAVAMNLEEPGVASLHAEALRGISCTNVSVYDVVNDRAGQIKLCQLAINNAKGAKATLTYEQAKERLAHTDVAKMFRKLCIVSGIYALADKEGKPSDPSKTGAANTTANAPTKSP